MKDKIITILDRFSDLSQQLANPAVIKDQAKYRQLAKEHRHLEPIVAKGRDYLTVLERIDEDEKLLSGTDEELKTIAGEEYHDLLQQRQRLEEELKLLLLPRDPRDDRNIIVEIRAGTGGEEAALFAADLFRMYSLYAERMHWKQNVLDTNETGIGGFKEIIISLEGKGVYGQMKYESGVHRVQRVPKTETGGRLHTSAATVAVLPEAEEADITIQDNDLKIDTFRASGAGGQHVNKTESAIRITHLPTGVVVTCQDEKSQHKNKTAALKVLRARLLALEQERLQKERADARRSMVSTGDRSVKIRTYNFPQGRLTDHRINYTSYRLEEILDGDLTELLEQLKLADQQAQLQAS